MTNINAVTDETVHEAVEQILASDMSPSAKVSRLDALNFLVWNYHPDRMTAYNAIEEISQAIDEVFYRR